jgi:hypothetical protein
MPAQLRANFGSVRHVPSVALTNANETPAARTVGQSTSPW